ncbi:glycosyltransferase [Pedobacter gandavensis]|uniref:Glycosyl transferase family 1 domain-containing protein n=1 Tax=Pedobacter gandavensis TaxID=2679963 RepID=A0ABR6F0F5_9SPHI|nr:glycosyltransferase [Pedobacter gandavensis]MBB2150970.1 hypothetical protein [Pedobacter gandavensis]
MNIKRSLKKLFRKRSAGDNGYLINLYQTNYERRVLISYIIGPFLGANGFMHQNYITSHIVAESFSELGYDVDIVEYSAKGLNIAYENYAVIFGMGENFERSFYHPARSIRRIHLITGAHDDFHNAMSLKSVKDFYELSGLWLTREANVQPTCNYYAMFNADAAIILARGTIFEDCNARFVNKLYPLNNNILGVFSTLAPKTVESRTSSFLFLSGGRQITKGLHLLMEVARTRKDLKFYVVVPSIDADLRDHYLDLLEEGSNVRLFERLRMDSEQIKDILAACSYSIAPSYVDGLPGGTIEPMSAGLIPIVSKHCGFASEKFIFEMEDLSAVALENTINRVLELKDLEFAELSRQVKKYAIDNFSPSCVKQELMGILKSEQLN